MNVTDDRINTRSVSKERSIRARATGAPQCTPVNDGVNACAIIYTFQAY